jgi:transmembrane sensor
VTAGERTVTALGTQFDVRLDPGSLQVTLIEGSVAVKSARAVSTPGVLLAPNQQLLVANEGVPTVRTVDAERTTAWTTGRVYFVDEPLESAIAEMNRYSTTAIVLGDSSLAHYRINGMFHAGNQASFVDALSAAYDIEPRAVGPGRMLLLRRHGPSSAN